jgi:hypothetical protein
MSYDKRHGGPYDRGSADSYYQRGYNPHYFVGDTYNSERVEMEDMTPQQITEYTKGYSDNEMIPSSRKEW